MLYIGVSRYPEPLVIAASGYDVAVEVVKLLPTILWIALLVYLVQRFYEPIRDKLLPNITSVKVPGFEIDIARIQIDKAVENSAVAAQVSDRDRSQVLMRAQAVAACLKGANVLWVDDRPVNNTYERRALNSFGIFIDTALSTDMALTMLAAAEYDLVISDMSREGRDDAGLRLAQALYEARVAPRAGNRNTAIDTIIYAGGYDPSRGTPPYVFAMTNRPDELFNYVMDVLERVRAVTVTASAAATRTDDDSIRG